MRRKLQNNGADEQTRTADLRITNALLYQLSYIGISVGKTRSFNPRARPRQRL